MQLDVTDQELSELTELVRTAHADIGPEIHHARDNEYREMLRHRRARLEGLLAKLMLVQSAS
jgi:hypothetical protein